MNPYRSTILPLNDIAELEAQWRGLEANSDCEFFLSWDWVGHWLTQYQPECQIVRICDDRQLVGLGLIVAHQEVRRWFVRSNTLRLHQTGDAAQDQIWIEYNTFLVHRDHGQAALRQATEALLGLEWDELIVGATREEDAESMARVAKLYRYNLWRAPCYGVPLEKLRQEGKNYLQSLTRNTRYQINRSLRLYESEGEVILERAETPTQALDMFESISEHHIRRWGKDSGFRNPQFVDFHQQLIHRLWDKDIIDLWHLRVGDRSLSYFYNFVYRGKVYFYLSAVCEAADPKHKPGLLGHALSIQHYLDTGKDFYDFMGGDERYKKSLARKTETLYRFSLQRDALSLQVERMLRRVKRLWQKQTHSISRTQP